MKKKNTNTKTAVKKAVKKAAAKVKTSAKAAKKPLAKKPTAKTATKKPTTKKTVRKVSANAKPSAAKPCTAAKNVENKPAESIGSIMAKGMSRYVSKFASAALALIALSIILVGCKSVPTVETMSATAKSVGVAAAAVCNVSGLDAESKTAIINIMNVVDDVVPTNSQKFVDAWMPIANAEVKKLVDEGKIDDGKGAIILAAVNVACKGVDYIFDIKYPKAREYEELVSAAVHGFNDGFLATITPNEKLSASPSATMDKDAYEYLKTTAYTPKYLKSAK